MRVAETRAVNRALRKAYGIGICSVEEIGSFDRSVAPERPVRKLPPKSANGNCSNGHGSNGNVNGNGTRVRDRLCQLIRQHKLDAELVKAYAMDFNPRSTSQAFLTVRASIRFLRAAGKTHAGERMGKSYSFWPRRTLT